MNRPNYIFGKKALSDLINNNPEKIILVNLFNANNDFLHLLKHKHIKHKIHNNKSFFNEFSSQLNHQFIITEIKLNKNNDIKEFLDNTKNKKHLLFLIIDGINDPQNFGAILRSAAVFNADGIIYKKDNQVQMTDTVVKASMGGINYLNFFKVTNLNNAIALLKDNGFWVYATTLAPHAEECHKVKYPNRTAIIFGNEKDGISNLVIKNSDHNIIIKMYGKVQSLNVSVAAGIILHEINKQFE